MKLHFGVGVLAGLTLLGGLAQADSIVGAGVFNLSGALYVSRTAIDFGFFSNPPPGDQKAIVVLPEIGQFTDLTTGQSTGIKNLNVGIQTPGTVFNFADWITLPDGINLDLTQIPIDTTAPLCSSSGSDTRCRPIPGSPIILTQNPTGVSAQMSVSGSAHFAGQTTMTAFKGLLSANFTNGSDATIAGLLGDFTKNGFIRTGYSGNFSTTTPTPTVPEPGTLATLGLGLLAAGILKKRKSAR